MTRTVKVGLDVDEQPYVRGMDKAAKATEKVADAADDATDSATALAAGAGKATDRVEDLGDSAKGAGRALGSLRDDAAKLDRQIEETSGSIRELAREIARTSDEATRADLAKKLAGQQGDLRSLVNLRKLIDVPDDSESREQGTRLGGRIAEGIADGVATAGGPISRALANVFGELPPQAQVALGASLVGVAAATAPVIANTVAGAVTAGVTVGVVGAGVMLAAKDPQVQAAGKALGAELSSGLAGAAASFVPVTLDGIDTIREAWQTLQPELRGLFSDAAPYVDTLVRAATGFAKELLPGIRQSVQAAGPLIEVLGEHGPKAAEAFSNALATLSTMAADGANTLDALFTVIEFGVEQTATGLKLLDLSMSPVGAGLMQLIGSTGEQTTAFKNFHPAATETATDLQATANAAAAAAVKVETLTEMTKRLVDANISAEQAAISLEAAIDRATEAGRKNTDGISAGNEKGRANRELLVSLAQASNDAAAAVMEQTGSQELANAKMTEGRKAFLAAADAMGAGKTEAKRLADQLFAIPRSVPISISANTSPAIDAARGAVARINSMKARINVYAEPSGGFGGSAHTGFGYSTGNRWGGVYTHAAEGVLREAAVYSPMNPARYAFAEPATGGEAFVPRNGNPDRSLGILDTAAGWYGKQLVDRQPQTATMMGRSTAQQSMSGAAEPGPVNVQVYVGDREITDIVRVEIGTHNRQLRRAVEAGSGAGR